MASFSSFLSCGQPRTACLRCWMRCKLLLRWWLPSAAAAPPAPPLEEVALPPGASLEALLVNGDEELAILLSNLFLLRIKVNVLNIFL